MHILLRSKVLFQEFGSLAKRTAYDNIKYNLSHDSVRFLVLEVFFFSTPLLSLLCVSPKPLFLLSFYEEMHFQVVFTTSRNHNHLISDFNVSLGPFDTLAELVCGNYILIFSSPWSNQEIPLSDLISIRVSLPVFLYTTTIWLIFITIPRTLLSSSLGCGVEEFVTARTALY